jgi:hypothetical protein
VNRVGYKERRTMNQYIMAIVFTDDEGYFLDNFGMSPHATSREEADDIIEKEIEDNPDLYPSDNYEIHLIDVC